MSGADDTDEWWTTDHRVIREWAVAHDAEPVIVDRADDTGLRLQPDPETNPGERLPWAAFFERFEAQSKALLYRGLEAGDGSRSGTAWRIVDREAIPARLEADETTERPAHLDSEQLALSDTGESEPVAFDRTEDLPAAGDHESGSAETTDQARATGHADALAIDTIDPRQTGLGDLRDTDGSVTIRNEGDEPRDVSEWTVGNDAGQSFRIPANTTIDPGARLTIHSGDGPATETDLYWEADDPVWPNRGGTVVVETPAGERVLETTYNGGR
ncbi:MAG: lamin tail domain-containing protein [Halorientalis sp.]